MILLTVEEHNEVQIPAKRASNYLSLHGIESRSDSRPQIGHTIADDILSCAFAEGAGYVVMGGYSHSRAGERLFGGVTRSLLKSPPFRPASRAAKHSRVRGNS